MSLYGSGGIRVNLAELMADNDFGTKSFEGRKEKNGK